VTRVDSTASSIELPGRPRGEWGDGAVPAPHPVEALLTATAAQPLLLRGAEVAQLLGIGRSKAYELMARRELPTIRIGQSIRVPKHALVAWIEERTRR
jgi:excisionase family DNA binding protein